MNTAFEATNRGKRSIAIDLKEKGAVERLTPLIRSADVVVEQFRPGVMERLGLGYEALKALNPRIVYCAITGYGQDGPLAQVAAHDLNYMAESGLAESFAFLALLAIGIVGLLLGRHFLGNFLPLGKAGEVPSAGFIFFLNLLIGLKVGIGISLILFALLREV